MCPQDSLRHGTKWLRFYASALVSFNFCNNSISLFYILIALFGLILRILIQDSLFSRILQILFDTDTQNFCLKIPSIKNYFFPQRIGQILFDPIRRISIPKSPQSRLFFSPRVGQIMFEPIYSRISIPWFPLILKILIYPNTQNSIVRCLSILKILKCGQT